MATIVSHLVASVRALATFSILCGFLYPLASLVMAQTLFPEKASGSIVTQGGVALGSALLSQKFTRPEFFHPRPSAADYATVASGASNLSPTATGFREAVERRAAELGAKVGEVPPDLLMASGSGLDPHISRDAALWQVPRVARARGLPEEELIRLVERKAFPVSSVFAQGAPVIVNVLELNVDLVQRR